MTLLLALPVLGLALMSDAFGGVLLVVGVIALLSVAVRAHSKADPRRPAEPVLKAARLPKVRREPPREIPLTATHCVICGRALSNSDSIRARVGSTCIKTYGPRYASGPNPDHETWVFEMARARADQAVEQARLEGEHRRALAEHPRLVASWEAELRTPEADARRAERAAVIRYVFPTTALVVAAVVGLAIG